MGTHEQHPDPTDAVADPVLDADRLSDIAGYDLTSEEVRTKLHAFARQAAVRLGLPMGLVSIVLDSAQYLAGMYGVGGWIAEAEGTPIEWSFCANAVRSGEDYVVEDAAVDPLQFDNPLVTEDGIRSYAGTPLVSPAGHVLGAFCVIGTEPRHFTPEEMAQLHLLSAEVVAEMERHRISLPAA